MINHYLEEEEVLSISSKPVHCSEMQYFKFIKTLDKLINDFAIFCTTIL